MLQLMKTPEYAPNPRAARVRRNDSDWHIELLDGATIRELTTLVCFFKLEVDGFNEADDIILRPTYPLNPAPTQRQVEDAIIKGPRRGLKAVKNMNTKQNGYTLIELIIVAAVVAILAGIAYATYPYIERARIAHAIGDIGEIHIKLNTFDLNNRRYPADLNELGIADQLDPWGNPYQFLVFDDVMGEGPKRKDHNMHPVNSDYDIYSMGPNGETATPFTSIPGGDDIVMAGDGTYFGRASDY